MTLVLGCKKKADDDASESAQVESPNEGVQPEPNVEGTATPNADAAANQAERSAATVELVNPGAEPRQTLRYAFARMQPQVLRMEMEMSTAMTMGGNSMPRISMPTMSYGMRFTEVTARDDGNLSATFEMNSFDVAAGNDPQSQAIAASLRGAMSDFSFSGTMVIDDRGNVMDTNFDFSNVPAGQDLSSMTQQMEQMTAPLPEEPIGVGGQWRVRNQLGEGMPIRLTQEATYTLRERNGDNVVVDVTMSQNAPRQEMNDPNMPEGASVRLNSMTTTGSGTMNMDLGALVPTSDLNMTINMSMATVMNGQETPMETNMTMRVGIRPGN